MQKLCNQSTEQGIIFIIRLCNVYFIFCYSKELTQIKILFLAINITIFFFKKKYNSILTHRFLTKSIKKGGRLNREKRFDQSEASIC